MTIEIVPEWMVNLEDEDIVFIKNFYWLRLVERSCRSIRCYLSNG